MKNTMHPLGSQIMHALVARFEANRQEALATMHLYLNASVGVGDHPNIVDELATATKQLTEAEENLETLQRNFLRPDPESEEDG